MAVLLMNMLMSVDDYGYNDDDTVDG